MMGDVVRAGERLGSVWAGGGYSQQLRLAAPLERFGMDG
jgi:hypothetical protein